MSVTNIYEQLERDEAKRNRPYRDSVGKLTIGVGHNLDDKPISDRAVRVILEDDVADARRDLQTALDRKSTRLNSSHVEISYAVFCLKKKKQKKRDENT